MGATGNVVRVPGRRVDLDPDERIAELVPERLEPLGHHALRGVREPREIYALDLGRR